MPCCGSYAFNDLLRSVFAPGRWGYFHWDFTAAKDGLRLQGRVEARREDFVGLNYRNPPGGRHLCLNSKIASCRLTLQRPGQPPLQLQTRNRAAFEILTDDTDTGVPVVV